MPRPRASDWIITSTPLTVAPASHVDFYIDLIDTFYPQVFYKAVWATTTSSTGQSVEIFRRLFSRSYRRLYN